MKDDFVWLMHWFWELGDSYWAKDGAISITGSLNGGWNFTVDLSGTHLEHLDFSPICFRKADDDFLECSVTAARFCAHASPNNLPQVLRFFCDWADPYYPQQEIVDILDLDDAPFDWLTAFFKKFYTDNVAVKISSSLDGGWTLDISAAQLQALSFDPFEHRLEVHDCYSCQLKDGRFVATCGPLNLSQAIKKLACWIAKGAKENPSLDLAILIEKVEPEKWLNETAYSYELNYKGKRFSQGSNDLAWLGCWYWAHCDYQWESRFAILFETHGKQGWKLKIPLEGSVLVDLGFGKITYYQDDDDWYSCEVDGLTFIGRSSPQNILKLFQVFRSWAEPHLPTIHETRSYQLSMRLGGSYVDSLEAFTTELMQTDAHKALNDGHFIWLVQWYLDSLDCASSHPHVRFETVDTPGWSFMIDSEQLDLQPAHVQEHAGEHDWCCYDSEETAYSCASGIFNLCEGIFRFREFLEPTANPSIDLYTIPYSHKVSAPDTGCDAAQLTILIQALDSSANGLIWYALEVNTCKNCHFSPLARGLVPTRIGSGAELVQLVQRHERFDGGQFLAFSRDLGETLYLEPSASYRELAAAINAFDGAYFELYSSDPLILENITAQ